MPSPLPTTAQYELITTAPAWVAARFDGCPKCHRTDNFPLVWGETGDTLICTYQCACGHAWWTGWSIEACRPEGAA